MGILDALSGLSNNVGPPNLQDQLDPTMLQRLSQLSPRDLEAVLAALRERQAPDFKKNMQQLPNMLGDANAGQMQPLGGPTGGQVGYPPPAFLDDFRSAVAPVGQPDYRNAGLVPSEDSPLPSPTPIPTPSPSPAMRRIVDVAPSPTATAAPPPTPQGEPTPGPGRAERAAGVGVRGVGTAPNAFLDFPQPSSEQTPSPPPEGSRVGTHVTEPPKRTVPSPPGLVEPGNIDLYSRPHVQNDDGTVSTVRSMSFGTPDGEVLVPTISDDGKHLSDLEAIANYRQTGKHLGIFDNPEHANSYADKLHQGYAAGDYDLPGGPTPTPTPAPTPGGGPMAEEYPWSSVPPDEKSYSEGGVGDLTGGSSPVPPDDKTYSDVGNLDMSLPSGAIVKDVVEKAREAPSPAPIPTPPTGTIGGVNVTDPPPVPPVIYPKDELTPADAGIGTSVAKAVEAAAPNEQSAGGGLSQLKNILAGFSPGSPAGQALLAFGFANAQPGGNFGTAGLQALQTYTSAQNRRAAEQLERDRMAARTQEIKEGRDFQVKRQEAGWKHGEATTRQAQEFQLGTEKWKVGVEEAQKSDAERRADERFRKTNERALKQIAYEKLKAHRAEKVAERKQRAINARAEAKRVADFQKSQYAPYTLRPGETRYESGRDSATGQIVPVPVAEGGPAGGGDAAGLIQSIRDQAATVEQQEAADLQAGKQKSSRPALAAALRSIASSGELGHLKPEKIAALHAQLMQKAGGEWMLQDIPPLGSGGGQGQGQQEQIDLSKFDQDDLAKVGQLRSGALPPAEIRDRIAAGIAQNADHYGIRPDQARAAAEQLIQAYDEEKRLGGQ